MCLSVCVRTRGWWWRGERGKLLMRGCGERHVLRNHRFQAAGEARAPPTDYCCQQAWTGCCCCPTRLAADTDGEALAHTY